MSLETMREDRRDRELAALQAMYPNKYRDSEGKVFSFPPPYASVQRFIDKEIWVEYDDALPR